MPIRVGGRGKDRAPVIAAKDVGASGFLVGSVDGEALQLYIKDVMPKFTSKVDAVTAERLNSAEVSSPDNLSWPPTSELLAASHYASIPEMTACQDLEAGNCGFRFRIVAVDPDTMDTRVILDHQGPPMGAATVALPCHNAVYVGTFAGDRISRVSDSTLALPTAR